VLDWGCGDGHFSIFLELLGARVTGYSYEPLPAVMRDSKTFEFVPGTPNEPSALPFPDGHFDAAVSMGVLEHVWGFGGDELASLRELTRVVKPGGTILTFHFPSSTGWIENMVRRLHLKKHLHGRRYDAAQIADLWRTAGIAIVDIARYNVLPRAELKLLPGFIRHSEAFIRAYNAADDLLTRALPRICTNYLVIGRTSG
jgi:SAM-dependent methyltransferase